MKKRVLFIDRDGTIIVEPPDTKQVDCVSKLEFLPNVISSLSLLARSAAYELVMVTNQDGLGTNLFPEERFWPAHNLMINILKSEGITFSEVLIDRSLEEENRDTRKPGIGLLSRYFGDEYDLASSFVIGDRVTDMQLAKNLGCQGIYLSPEQFNDAVFCSPSWSEVEKFLFGRVRYGEWKRVTQETSIEASVALYGSGRNSIRTGLGFFDHMLNLFGANAGFDLTIEGVGDLYVDEHHLIEDTGIVLGEIISRALGTRAGITRYAFVLPMDEAIAEVAIDISGRPHLEWDATFQREWLGDVPTEMIKHFFQSLAFALKATIHISCRGENEHHKAEAIFKGVGRAFRSAVARYGDGTAIPSTKGVL